MDTRDELPMCHDKFGDVACNRLWSYRITFLFLCCINVITETNNQTQLSTTNFGRNSSIRKCQSSEFNLSFQSHPSAYLNTIKSSIIPKHNWTVKCNISSGACQVTVEGEQGPEVEWMIRMARPARKFITKLRNHVRTLDSRTDEISI